MWKFVEVEARVVGGSGWWMMGRGNTGDDGAMLQLAVAAVQRC